MDSPLKIFGAKAAIPIRYEGDIHTLGAKLSKGLMIPDFNISPREYPPHGIQGTAETLGWEMWLERIETRDEYKYSLRMETEDSFEEIRRNQMHDISPWLARFVTKICKLDARPASEKP